MLRKQHHTTDSPTVFQTGGLKETGEPGICGTSQMMGTYRWVDMETPEG